MARGAITVRLKYRSTILWMNRCTFRGNGRFAPRSVNRIYITYPGLEDFVHFETK